MRRNVLFFKWHKQFFSVSSRIYRNNSSYKAAVLKEFGEPLVVEKVAEKKELGADEVRVQVKYCSVNYLDCLAFKGSHKKVKVPFIPGYEFSGEVVEIGSKVTPKIATVGEQVVALNLEKCSGFAEQAVVSANDVFRLPAHVDLRDAAVIASAHSTALYAFSKVCKTPPQEGNFILISCGPSGLGLAAVDVATGIYKAKVIGVCDTENRAAFIRDKGAFAAFKFNSKEDMKKQILSKTKNPGVHFVYDAIGIETLETLWSCVLENGECLSASVNTKTLNIKPVVENARYNYVSLNHLRKTNMKLYRQIVSDTLDMMEDGGLNAHISAKFPLEKINEAIKFVENKESTGKVLIEMG